MSRVRRALRDDLASVSSPAAVLRWARHEPAAVARVVAVLLVSAFGTHGLLVLVGGEDVGDWLVLGVVVAVAGLVQPDLSPYRSPGGRRHSPARRRP